MPHVGPRLVRRGVALGAASIALSVSLTVAAAEPWPPATPPRVELDGEPIAPAPIVPLAPAAPVVPATPAPVAPARAAPEPAPVERPAGRVLESKGDEPVVARAAAPPPPSLPFARYGSRDGQLYLGAWDDALVLLPTARVELDARALETEEQNASRSTTEISLARLELAGWLGRPVYFDVGADFAHGPSARDMDEYIAVAPWGDRGILQIGQFDAPFTLENRTAQRYLDLGDRGAAIRGFAIPRNKAEGAMVHGTNPARNFYYSAGLFNGAGPGATSVDGQVDAMARGWVAPFSFRDPEGLRDITIGGSLWTGDRSFGGAGAPFDAQKTAAGYDVIDPTVWVAAGTPRLLELRQDGRVNAVGLELNAPMAHKYGARFEWIWKRQALAVVDTSLATASQRVGGMTLSGFGTYVEAWGWLLGDDSLLGPPAAPGLQLPLRLGDFAPRPATSGLMVAARVDYVDQDLSADARTSAAGLGVASLGTTKLTTLTLGASYWYSRRVRVLMSYVFNYLDGSTPYVSGLDANAEHEILLRTSLAL